MLAGTVYRYFFLGIRGIEVFFQSYVTLFPTFAYLDSVLRAYSLLWFSVQ